MTGVEFYSYFSQCLTSVSLLNMHANGHIENKCPNSYVYAYDESSGTALWTCNAALNADYTITFCP